ncbi:MAG TPA: hypothetical protein VJ692_14845 [Nitrospiraceae bacterium]|nr:hypothetical protein [Nitrospiraceae bacterium]
MDRWKDRSRIGAVSAMAGAVLLVVGTSLHPSKADSNDALAAFTEYAADQLWVTSHVAQLLGIVLILSALVLLSWKMADGPAAQWACLGAAGTVGCLAATSVLQAVDGIALKGMVDAWASAPDQEKASLFQAAFGVRQIEIGLASITSLLSGATVSVYGIALMIDRRGPTWLEVLGIASGSLTLVAGMVMAYTGFSAVAMAISMPSSLLLLAWIIGVGVFMWPPR